MRGLSYFVTFFDHAVHFSLVIKPGRSNRDAYIAFSAGCQLLTRGLHRIDVHDAVCYNFFYDAMRHYIETNSR